MLIANWHVQQNGGVVDIAAEAWRMQFNPTSWQIELQIQRLPPAFVCRANSHIIRYE